MKCGNGSERTQHPFELFGEDWRDWGHDFVAEAQAPIELAGDRESAIMPSGHPRVSP